MASGFADQDFLRYVRLLRLGPDCFYHTEVVRQSIDKNPSFCLLERRDLQLEAGMEINRYQEKGLTCESLTPAMRPRQSRHWQYSNMGEVTCWSPKAGLLRIGGVRLLLPK